ncbi:hypothetical protein AGMMS49991_10140 [Spirochaetia bacterium]|nr:hypothetical protein AGMMS49991_10140 [Spirochaetia bacterium]
MEQTDDLRGMKAADAKEYIFQYITTLKLTEKRYGELQGELDKWKGRVALARSKGAADLADGAEREAVRISAHSDTLAGEIADLKAQIGTMRRQLPGLAARERSIDPDILEQELKIALGVMPGEDNPEQRLDREIDGLNADAALAALKAQMIDGAIPAGSSAADGGLPA